MTKYKKRGTAKSIILVLALLLTMGAAATSLAMGIKNNGWFEKENAQTEEDANVDNDALDK